MNKDRKGDWMQTASGRRFWPIDPRPGDFDINDIAHALSHMCRYAGHTNKFYSVAQHSVLVSRVLPPELRMWGLMHDASEAYIVDIPRPLKPYLTNYKELEENVMTAIAVQFGLTPLEMPSDVKRVDNAILVDEMEQLMSAPAAPWNLPEPGLHIHIDSWPPEVAKNEFLLAFKQYQSADSLAALSLEVLPIF